MSNHGFRFDPWGKESPDDPAEELWSDLDEDTQDRVTDRVDELRDHLLDLKGLRNIPPPEPLVADMLDLNTLSWLHGKPGHGKTFVAVDIACCVGTGLPWHGYKTFPGLVVYVIAEGAAGLSRRVDAWALANGTTPVNVKFLPIAIQLLDSRDIAAFATLITDLRPVLIVIDTQARTTVGAEENSSRDMGRLVAALERLRQTSGGCLLVVHHEPRNGENLRGHSGLEGAAATVLRASKDGRLVRVDVAKQKDRPEEPPLTLALTPLGDSCVLSHEAVGLAAIMTESEHTLLGLARDSFGKNGASKTELRDASGLPKSSYYRALNSLTDKGLLVVTKVGRGSFYVPAMEVDQPEIPTSPTESQ